MKKDYWIQKKGNTRSVLPFNTVQDLIYSISDENGDFSESEYKKALSEVVQRFSNTSRMLFFPGHVIFPCQSRRFILTGDFWIGQFPVSFEEYDSYCHEVKKPRPNDEGGGRGSEPVFNVSWLDAIEYCNWISRHQGLPSAYTPDGFLLDYRNRLTSDITQVAGYRLPTLAELVYATPKQPRFLFSGKVRVKRERFKVPFLEVRRENFRQGLGISVPRMHMPMKEPWVETPHSFREWVYDRYNGPDPKEAFDIDSHQRTNFLNPIGKKSGAFHSQVEARGKQTLEYCGHETERFWGTFRLALSHVPGITPDFSDNTEE